MSCLARGAAHWLFTLFPFVFFVLWRGSRSAPKDHLASQLARAVPRVVRDHRGLCCITCFLIILLGVRVLDEAVVAPIHVFHIRVADLAYWQ